jgi:hypothetical protein
MDLQEARQVLWFKNYPRPLGELFDEGYLYRTRLAWAAEKAYDSRIREAATVLLAALPAREQAQRAKRAELEKTPIKSFDVGISLQQARLKIWPFAPHKGQTMGALIDARQLTLKDLGFAAETAWDDGVRKAAMAFILERLDQILKEPPPTTGLVEVHAGGRSYAKQRETWFTFLQGGLYGILACVVVALSTWTVGQAIRGPTHLTAASVLFSTPAKAVAAVVAIALLAVATWVGTRLPDVLDRRLQKQVNEARRGQDGEDRVLEVILQALDGSWRVFRNVRVPGARRSDVDVVLVGPPGVWALEVKNLQGEYRNMGDDWQYRHNKSWKPSQAQPGQEARHHAAALGRYLSADGVKVFATPVVVWASEAPNLGVNDPAVPVWNLDRLPDELGNIWYSRQMITGFADRIADKLTRLCERQRATEARSN